MWKLIQMTDTVLRLEELYPDCAAILAYWAITVYSQNLKIVKVGRDL